MVFHLDPLWLMQKILSVQYSVPDYVRVSMECRHLLSQIFVASPEKVTDLIYRILLFSASIKFLLDKRFNCLNSGAKCLCRCSSYLFSTNLKVLLLSYLFMLWLLQVFVVCVFGTIIAILILSSILGILLPIFY